MKKSLLALALTVSSSAIAAPKYTFAGSDTLAGALTDAIVTAGLDSQIQYAGGGSGLAEKGLLTGDQGIAPMSRPLSDDASKQLTAMSVTPKAHVLALDGLSMYVKTNNPVPALDMKIIARIYNCEITSWDQVPNAGIRGAIKAYRRNDSSGTTDAFKHFTGMKSFGKCVTALPETADIADVTSRDPQAIGYSGLSGKVAGNRAVAISAAPGSPAVLPTTATIRNFSYPMARKLFLYEVTGAKSPNAAEKTLLIYVTDRSFMDPIMQAHEFITID